MILHFSQHPGRHERHLRRRRGNPLFPEHQREFSAGELTEAQRLDHEELVDFIGHFRGLVQQAVNLKPNEDSEVVLALKEQLDKAYEQAAGLADDQQETKVAIVKLTRVIAQTIARGAAGDEHALMELEQERQARSAHYQLLEYPLVADLLDPQSPIAADDLTATLLSSSADELRAALQLFDAEQLALLCSTGRTLLQQTDTPSAGAVQRLRQLELALTAATPPGADL